MTRHIDEPHIQLAHAIALSADLHSKQFDKGGKPYILHCLKVMHYLKSEDYELCAGAVLHDAVEDAGLTYEQMREKGFSDRVIEMVRCMTKIPGQTPEEYEIQVCSNQDSMKIKLSDLRHNSDIRRLKGVTEKDVRRIEKYMGMYERIKFKLSRWNEPLLPQYTGKCGQECKKPGTTKACKDTNCDSVLLTMKNSSIFKPDLQFAGPPPCGTQCRGQTKTRCRTPFCQAGRDVGP